MSRARLRSALVRVGAFTAAVLVFVALPTLPGAERAWALSPSYQVVFLQHGFSDALGPEAYYFDVVGALGLVRGESGTGGPCRPDDSVTRAEFAVMVARLLALDPDFKAPEPTAVPFQDAADIPGWATEAAGTCTSLGIIRGIPVTPGFSDFRPNDAIGGAEATAMLLRALGNANEVTGGWPAGYVYRAGETGLCSSEVVPGDWRLLEPLRPVSRAQMAYLLHNAVFSQRDYHPAPAGAVGTFSRQALGHSLSTYITVSQLDLDRRTLTGLDGRTYRLAARVVAPGLREDQNVTGRKFYALQDGDGQVVYLSPVAGGTTMTGTVKTIVVRGAGVGVARIELVDGRVIPCETGAVVELNGRRWPFPLETLLPTATATATLQGGKAVYVTIIQDDLPEAVIKSLAFASSGPDGQVTGEVGLGLPFEAGVLPVLIDSRTQLYLNGQTASLADLRERDICYVATQGDRPKKALRLYAHRERVEGEVNQVYRRFTAEGSAWEVVVRLSRGETRVVIVAETCAARIESSLVGRFLVFYLNREGRAAFFTPPLPPAGEPKVVRVLATWDLPGARRLTVEWLGDPVTYAFPAPSFPAANSLQTLTVDGAGTIIAVAPVRPALYIATVQSVEAGTGRVTLTSELMTWTLNVSGVPLFHTAPDTGVGPYLDPALLQPGQPVWLDDPGAPSYILVGPLPGQEG